MEKQQAISSSSSSSFPRFRLRSQVSEEEIQTIVRECRDNGGEINFSGADLSKDISLFIADFVGSNDLQSSLTALNLSNTLVQSKALESLLQHRYCSLQKLNLSNNFLGGRDVGTSLARLLTDEDGCLEVLDISSNRLGDVGMKSMCTAFSADLSSTALPLSLLSLRVLDLSDNGLTDASVLSLCRGLLSFTKQCIATNQSSKFSLQVLRLDGNKFTDNAALCLAQLLQTNNSLSKNNLQASTFQLSELSINDNRIEEKGMTALLLAVTDCRDLSLKTLKMARNIPSVAVIYQIANILSFNVALSCLEVDFTMESAISIIDDPDYPASVASLLHAFTSQTSRLIDLSLGCLYTATKQLLEGSTSDDEAKKMKKVINDFDSLRDILREPTAAPAPAADVNGYGTLQDSFTATVTSKEDDDIDVDSIVGAIEEVMSIDESKFYNQNSTPKSTPTRSSFNDDEYIEKEFERMRTEQSSRFQAMSTEIKRMIRPMEHSSPSYSPSSLQQRYEQSITPGSVHGDNSGVSEGSERNFSSPASGSQRSRNKMRRNATLDPNAAAIIAQEVDVIQAQKPSPLILKPSSSSSPLPPPPRSPKRSVTASWENMASVTNNSDGTITITADAMKTIIGTAVTTALESAHKNWYLDQEKSAGNHGNSAITTSVESNNNKIIPIQSSSSSSSSLSRHQAASVNRSYTRFPSSTSSSSSHSIGFNNFNTGVGVLDKKGRAQEYESNRHIFEMEKKISRLENRLNKLEGQFDVGYDENDLNMSPKNTKRDGTGIIRNILSKLDGLKDLESRMDIVEDAVEKEHQSSLQILDMLMQAEKMRQQQKQDMHSSSSATLYHSPKGSRGKGKNSTSSRHTGTSNASVSTRFRV